MNVDASSGWTNCLISTLSVEYKADLYSTYGGGQFLWCLYLFIRWAVPAVFDLQIGRGQKHICPLHLNSGGGWVGGGGVRVHILPIRGTPLQGAALRNPSGRCPKPRKWPWWGHFHILFSPRHTPHPTPVLSFPRPALLECKAVVSLHSNNYSGSIKL